MQSDKNSEIHTLKQSIINQENFIRYTIQHFHELSPMQKKDKLNDLSRYAGILSLPFIKILDNENYLQIIMASYNEFPIEIKNLLFILVEGFSFEKEIDTSIPIILKLANQQFIQVKPRKVKNFLEEIYVNVKEELQNSKFLVKKLKENSLLFTDPKVLSEIQEILARIDFLLQNKLSIIDKSWSGYVYDFIFYLSSSLIQCLQKLLYFPQVKNLIKNNAVLNSFSNHFDIGVLNSTSKSYQNTKQTQINLSSSKKICTIDPKFKTSFIEGEFIDFDEGTHIEYKYYSLPFYEIVEESLKKQICSFLNAEGGRIYIGINDNHHVVGIRLNESQRQVFIADISNYTSKLCPEVNEKNLVVVQFVPIKNEQNEYLEDIWVAKIIVKQGDPTTLYSISKETLKVYIRLDGQCIKLDTKNIHYHFQERISNPKKMLDPMLFEDITPEEPKMIKYDKNVRKNEIKSEIPSIQNPENQISYGIACRDLPSDIKEQELIEIFKNYGLYTKLPIALIKNKVTNLCTGIGYVNFSNELQAIQAYKDNDKKIKIRNRDISIQYQGKNFKI